jgi:hypothetical protein
MRRPEPGAKEGDRKGPPWGRPGPGAKEGERKGPPWGRPGAPRAEGKDDKGGFNPWRRPARPVARGSERPAMPSWGRPPWGFPGRRDEDDRRGETASREDLDRRLERLIREFEELRRDLQRTPDRR